MIFFAAHLVLHNLTDNTALQRNLGKKIDVFTLYVLFSQYMLRDDTGKISAFLSNFGFTAYVSRGGDSPYERGGDALRLA